MTASYSVPPYTVHLDGQTGVIHISTSAGLVIQLIERAVDDDYEPYTVLSSNVGEEDTTRHLAAALGGLTMSLWCGLLHWQRACGAPPS